MSEERAPEQRGPTDLQGIIREVAIHCDDRIIFDMAQDNGFEERYLNLSESGKGLLPLYQRIAAKRIHMQETAPTVKIFNTVQERLAAEKEKEGIGRKILQNGIAHELVSLTHLSYVPDILGNARGTSRSIRDINDSISEKGWGIFQASNGPFFFFHPHDNRHILYSMNCDQLAERDPPFLPLTIYRNYELQMCLRMLHKIRAITYAVPV